MNSKRKPFFHPTARIAAFACGLSIAASTSLLAAFKPLPASTAETPGLALSGTAGLSGTIVAARDTSFQTTGDFKGTLRSLVVDTGTTYDFYYQLINTGTDLGTGADFFRMKTTAGFTGLTLSVTYATDITSLNRGAFTNGPAGGIGAYVAGTKSTFSADRDVGSPGSVGFDFGSTQFLGDSANINPGQVSFFTVIRTNVHTFVDEPLVVSGVDTGTLLSYTAVVPEPGTSLLLALGCAALARRRSVR